MSSRWPAVSYEEWSETCDTLHAHTQVLGKLAVALAPAEPQLQHAALRLTARGWETAPLPAPDGSGMLVVVLDLRSHEVVVESSKRGVRRVALVPDRSSSHRPKTAGSSVERSARRGRRACTVRPRAGRLLLCRRYPCGACPHCVPRSLSRTLDASEC